MRRVISSLLVFICMVLCLSGCQQNKQPPQDTGIDYNQYIYAHGRVAYTQDTYLFFENGMLQFLEPTLSAPLSKLCTRPDCSHRDASCSAWLNATQVFAAGDHLYYVGQDEAGMYGLYEMSTTGEARRCVREIPVISGVNCGFSSRVYGSYLALEVSKWNTSAPSYMVYLTDYTDPEGEFSLVLGGEENTETEYAGIELRDGWLFAQATDVTTKERTLAGYDIQAGEAHTLVEDWSASNAYALKDGTLYWTAPGDGFYSLSLDTMEQTKLGEWNGEVGVGLAIYDDQYLYLSNALSQTASTDGDDRGVYIYDYHGNQVDVIPVESSSQSPVFLLSTPQYVFFYDVSQGLLPKWYLDKGNLGQGNTQLKPVPTA